MLANQAPRRLAPAMPVFAGKPAPTGFAGRLGPVGASLLANQAPRRLAPAMPVFAGKPAPTGFAGRLGPVGAWLAGDGPRSGPLSHHFSATLDFPWRVSISSIRRLASAG
ncbi:hypothetical protein E3U47_02685 [Pseudomonas sp. RIT623]|nr:hypothetical protein E3U47_02685 [Pseudomonas sp. RIT623]